MKITLKYLSFRFLRGIILTVALMLVVIIAMWLLTGPILLTIFSDKVAFMLLYLVNLPIIGGFASMLNLI